jgi:hypothetical protein
VAEDSIPMSDDSDSNDSAFYCANCSGKFSGLNELRAHIAEAHPDPAEKKTTAGVEQKIPPMPKCLRDSAYYCGDCSFKSWSITDMTQHRKEMHS